MWYSHICVECRNLSLKLDVRKECLNMLYTYLVLAIVHESLSLEMATDSFTYCIIDFGLTLL